MNVTKSQSYYVRRSIALSHYTLQRLYIPFTSQVHAELLLHRRSAENIWIVISTLHQLSNNLQENEPWFYYGNLGYANGNQPGYFLYGKAFRSHVVTHKQTFILPSPDIDVAMSPGIG